MGALIKLDQRDEATAERTPALDQLINHEQVMACSLGFGILLELRSSEVY